MTGIRPERVNPYAVKRVNPYAQRFDPELDDPTQEEPVAFTEHLGNFASYLRSLATEKRTPVGDESQMYEALGKNVYKSGKNFVDWFFTNPFSDKGIQQTQKLLNDGIVAPMQTLMQNGLIGENQQGLIPQMLNSAFTMFAEQPIEFITGAKNQAGQAVPMTPEEQAQRLQSVAGTIAMLGVASKLHNKFLKAPSGIDALIESKKTFAGRLLPVMTKDAAIGAVSGGVQAGIASMGSDDQATQILANSLGMAPIGLLFGATAGYRGYTKGVREGAAKFQRVLQPKAFEDLAALDLWSLRNLKTTTQSSIQSIAASIDGIATSDNLLQAYFKARMETNEGFLIPNISDETLRELVSKFSAKPERVKPIWTPDLENEPLLTRGRPNYGGDAQITAKFKDPFDQAAMKIAANPKKESSVKLLEDIKSKTDLTDQDIIGHGKQVIAKRKELIATGGVKRLTEQEIEQLRGEIRTRGEEKLVTAGEGAEFKDANGRVWVKKGQNLVNEKDGLIYNVNEDTAKMIVGRRKNEIEPSTNAGYVELDSQSFTPMAGDKTYTFNFYKSKDGTVAVVPSSIKYNDNVIKFFEESGFFPNEIVSVVGKDHVVLDYNADNQTVNVKEFGTGKVYNTDIEYVTRKPGGLNSEFYKAEGGTRAGVLNETNYINRLYESFKKYYDLGSEASESFDATFRKFAEEFGFNNPQDAFKIQGLFYEKLREDAIKMANSPEDAAHISNIQKQLEEYNTKSYEDLAQYATNLAEANGLYLSAEGGGKYHIRFAEDKRLYQTVSSIDEAVEAINKAGQKTDGFDLDGGNTNGVPTSISPLVKPRFVDVINVFKATKIAPRAEYFASASTISSKPFFERVYLKLQDAQQRLKRYDATPMGAHVRELYNDIAKTAKEYKLTPDELRQVSDLIETMSPQEVIDKYLFRKMTAEEIKLGKNLAKQDVSAVIDYLYDIRMKADDAPFDSQEFLFARNDVVSNGKYSPEVLKAGDQFLHIISNSDKTKLDGSAVLRYAQAVKDPANALSREQFAAKYRLTTQQLALAKKLDRFYQFAGKEFGIQNEALIGGYLPHVKLYEATGYNPFAIKESATAKFVHELNRLGIIKNGLLERDPIAISYKYLMTGMKSKSGYLDAFNEGVKANRELVKELNQSNPTLAKVIGTVSENYINDVRGLPDIDTQISRAHTDIYGKHGWIPETRSVVALVNLALQGGFRWALAARDIHSAIGKAYTYFDASFVKDAFFKSLSKKEMLSLQRNGAIYKTEGLDLIYPTEDAHLPGFADSKLAKASEIGLHMTGQTVVYNHGLAGIYRASRDRMLKTWDLYQDKKLTKQQAFDKLSLEIHNPEVQRVIQSRWELAEQGKGDILSAADLYGKFNGKKLMAWFGNNNAPDGWNTRWGKLLGQYGNWGVNEGQNIMELVSGVKQNRGKALWRLTKYTSFYGATWMVGSQLGLDLKSWMSNPFGLYGVGPIFSFIKDISMASQNMMSTDPSTRTRGMNDAMRAGRILVPFSSEFNDIRKAYELWEEGRQEMAIPRAIGFSVAP